MPKPVERKQSAAIAWRRRDSGEVEILLVSSRRGRRWVLPKGKVPRGMPAHASAAREAREEGGVIGDVAHVPVGFYRLKPSLEDPARILTRIPAYSLHVWQELDIWPEMHMRERRWMSLSDALQTVSDPGLRRTLKAFARSLKAQTTGIDDTNPQAARCDGTRIT